MEYNRPMTASSHKLYQTYRCMMQRCYRTKNDNYKNYGGRSISVCDRWRQSFWLFVEDMGDKPPKHTLDRIDNNGNYEPSNCKWSTRREQNRNTTRAVIVEIDGKKMTLADACDLYGVRLSVADKRLRRGMSIDKVLSPDPIPCPNILDYQKVGTMAAAKKARERTTCKRGHEFSEANTYLAKNGSRSCKICRLALARKSKDKRKTGVVRPLEYYLP